jgi:soluble P-type ATPase
MRNLTIPGWGDMQIEHVVFDFNGTLAIDGSLIEGVEPHLRSLSKKFELHIVTGDSCGTAKMELANINCRLLIVPNENQSVAKVNYLATLNPDHVIAIGNGRNDQQMLQAARLSIAVLGEEGLAFAALSSADIVVDNIFSAIALLRENTRLLATLRT